MNRYDRDEIAHTIDMLELVRAGLLRAGDRHLTFGTDEGLQVLDVAAGELSDVIHNLTVDLVDIDDLAVSG